MRTFFGRGAAVTLLALAVASSADAQGTRGETIRIRRQGPSAADLSLYGLTTFDRAPQGGRSVAMGGTSLALNGDASNTLENPASVAFLTRPVLGSETRYRFGSSSAEAFPVALRAPGGLGEFGISEYEPKVTTNYTYNNVSYGMPLLFLGRQAGIGFGYRRLIDFRGGDEARFVVESPFGDADFGLGSAFKGGIDAITPTFAIQLTPRISAGGSINFLGGTITENGDQGVAVFGQVVARGAYFFQQEVYGTAVDLGTQIRLSDRLTLGGVVQPGYDLDFKKGEDAFQPIPDPTAQVQNIIILERDLMDHTLSVPTQYGAGAAYKLGDGKVTLAADYWNRAWSNARIRRNSFSTLVFFPDSMDLTTNFALVVPGSAEVEKDAKLQDTHHFRLGLEWFARGSEGSDGFRIPIRVGFRREPLTFTSLDTAAYNELRRDIDAAATGDGPLEERREEVRNLINELYQNGSNLLAGDKTNSTVLTAGFGIEIGVFSADFAVARQSYDVDRIFLGAFADFTRDPDVRVVREKRSVNQFTFSTMLRF